MNRRILTIAVLLAASAAVAETLKIASPCESGRQELSPTGKHVAVFCNDHSVRVLKLPDGQEVVNVSASKRVSASAFSTDGGKFGAGSEDGEVRVWSLEKPNVPKQWKAGAVAVDAIAFVPHGNVVALAMHAGPGAVWDFSGTPVKKARLETDFDGLTAAAASSDGKWLVTTGADTVVRTYETASWKKTSEYRDMKLEPFAVAFTPDGKYAVVGGADRRLTLFDPSSGKAVKELDKEADPILELHPVDDDRLVAVYFDADGRKPVHLKLWNIANGSNSAVEMAEGVTGGGVAQGQVWFIRASAKDVELSTGK